MFNNSKTRLKINTPSNWGMLNDLWHGAINILLVSDKYVDYVY